MKNQVTVCWGGVDHVFNDPEHNYTWEIDESLVLIVYKDGKMCAAFKEWDNVFGTHDSDVV